MYCISVNHKNANIEIRKRLAFSLNEQILIMKEINALEAANQCVILCTCCRTEIYFNGSLESMHHVRNIISRYGGIDAEDLLPHIMSFAEESAMLHLFRVACGIDSMVIGEDEILGQTRNAYKLAAECGTVGYEFNMTFQSAIACARKIKTGTALSGNSISMAALAANEAVHSAENPKILLIGASGKTGSAVLRNLITHKNASIVFTMRTHSISSDIIHKGGSRLKGAEYSERYNFIDNADCIISATSGPHFTIILRDLKNSIKTSKNRLFIDLAVPPDIDPDVTELEGVRLFGIDYFRKLAEHNNAVRLNSIDAAENIIHDELETLKKELAFHSFLPYSDKAYHSMRNKMPEELIYKFKSELSAEQFAAVLEILKNYS